MQRYTYNREVGVFKDILEYNLMYMCVYVYVCSCAERERGTERVRGEFILKYVPIYDTYNNLNLFLSRISGGYISSSKNLTN